MAKLQKAELELFPYLGKIRNFHQLLLWSVAWQAIYVVGKENLPNVSIT